MTILDPNKSAEAKQQAREGLDSTTAHCNTAQGVDDNGEEIHSHRVLGGYEATLNVCVHFASVSIRA